MLNFAMVLMILAGICGLPAALCGAACAGMMSAAANDPRTSATDSAGMMVIGGTFLTLSLIASVGSIIVGALVRKIGKVPAGLSALAFAAIFVVLILQANPWGLPSALMLVLSAIMIFVAPRPEFTGIAKVQVEQGRL